MAAAGQVRARAAARSARGALLPPAGPQDDRQGAVQRGVPRRGAGRDIPGSPGEDVVATLAALTAETVALAVEAHGVDTLVCSGGGCANPTLMAMLRERLCGGHGPTHDRARGAGRHQGGDRVRASSAGTRLHGLPAIVPRCTGAAGADPGCDRARRRPVRLPVPWRSPAPSAARAATARRCPRVPMPAPLLEVSGPRRSRPDSSTGHHRDRPRGGPAGRMPARRSASWARAAPASRSRCWP